MHRHSFGIWANNGWIELRNWLCKRIISIKCSAYFGLRPNDVTNESDNEYMYNSSENKNEEEEEKNHFELYFFMVLFQPFATMQPNDCCLNHVPICEIVQSIQIAHRTWDSHLVEKWEWTLNIKHNRHTCEAKKNLFITTKIK